MLVLDVSNNNGIVDFTAVRRFGVRAVYLKASEGATFVDPYFASSRRNAARAGLAVGAYHFAIPSRATGDAYAEARHFLSVVRSVGAAELRPVLDFETNPHSLNGAELDSWARTFVRATRAALGVGPIFYSYPSFITGMRSPHPIGYGLWLASYGPNDAREHPWNAPPPWKHAVLHQFTSAARVPGVRGEADLSNAPNGLRPLYAHPVRAALSLRLR